MASIGSVSLTINAIDNATSVIADIQKRLDSLKSTSIKLNVDTQTASSSITKLSQDIKQLNSTKLRSGDASVLAGHFSDASTKLDALAIRAGLAIEKFNELSDASEVSRKTFSAQANAINATDRLLKGVVQSLSEVQKKSLIEIKLKQNLLSDKDALSRIITDVGKVGASGSNASSFLSTLTGNARQALGVLDSIIKKTAEVTAGVVRTGASTASSLGSLVKSGSVFLASITIVASGLKSVFDGVLNLISGIANKIVEIGRTVINTGKLLLEQAGDFQSQFSDLEVFFGDKANVAFQGLRKIDIASALDLKTLSEGARLLASSGVAVEDVTNIVSRLADVSGTSGDKFVRLARAFSQVKNASKLTGEELNQFTDAGLPLGALIADRFGKPLADLNRAGGESIITFAEFFDLFNEQTDTFAGRSVKLSQTVNGLKNTLGSIKDQFLATIGGFDIDTGVIKVGSLADIVQNIGRQIVSPDSLTKINEIGTQLSNKLGGALSKALGGDQGNISFNISGLLDKISSSIAGFDANKIGEGFGGVFKRIRESLSDLTAEDISSFFNKIAGVVKEGFKFLVEAFDYAKKNITKESIDSALNTIKDIASTIEVTLKLMTPLFKEFGREIKEFVALVEFLGKAGSAIKNFFSGNEQSQASKPIIPKLNNDDFVNDVLLPIDNVKEKLLSIPDVSPKITVVDGATEPSNGIKDTLLSIPDRDPVVSVIDEATLPATDITDTINNIPDKTPIVNLQDNATVTAQQIQREIFNIPDNKNIFINAFSNIRDIVSDIAFSLDGIRNGVQIPVELTLNNSAQNILDSLPSYTPPQFMKGGIVTRASGGTIPDINNTSLRSGTDSVLALLTPGEHVISKPSVDSLNNRYPGLIDQINKSGATAIDKLYNSSSTNNIYNQQRSITVNNQFSVSNTPSSIGRAFTSLNAMLHTI